MTLDDLTALEQATAIRDGQITAVELAEHYLARSASVPGAFVTLTPDVALQQAAAVDAGEVTGPLAGVVCPVKDLFFMVGSSTRFGSVAYDFPAMDDDFVVKAMRAAGLVFTGKTTTPEFGLPCYTEPDPSVSAPARNVWDPERTAGGSSGGAAVAVAAGLAPIAHGSDGGGSVRIPAAANGLVGIKPSRGRISNGPLRDPIGDLVTSGPIARTVADAAALLDVMAQPFPGDPFYAPPPQTTFLAAATAPPRRLRIGYFTHPIIADVPVHPEAETAVAGAVSMLEELGHEVRAIHRPFGPDAMQQFEHLWYVLALLTPVMPDDEQRLMPTTRYLRGLGSQVSGISLAQAVSLARIQTRAATQLWSELDVVVTPAINGPAPLVSDLVDLGNPAQDFENQKAWAAYTAAFNMTGQPAISLPLHTTEGGLPVGVQFVGQMFGEHTLLTLAAQIEAAFPWHERKPVSW